MTGDFFKTNWRILFAVSVLAIILAVFLSWHTYTSPQTAWHDMLVNNLSARSVTKNQVVSSDGESQIQNATIQFGPQYTARSLVTVQNGAGSVTTETLATPTDAYLRYANITDKTKKHDYDSLVNIWAKAGNDSTGDNLRQVFNNSILDISIAPVPPVGYVEPGKRAELLQYLASEAVFSPDYKQVKTEVINGRKVYTYTVTVKLAPYLRAMQEFAHVYGLKDLDSVNPNEYQSATLKLNISVDKLSHQMARVTSTTLGLNETYTDFGRIQAMTLPTKTVSVGDLQNRFQAIK